MPARDGAVRVPEDLGIVVGVQINKAGGDKQPVGIQHRSALQVRMPSR